jgi:hypothetical protein
LERVEAAGHLVVKALQATILCLVALLLLVAAQAVAAQLISQGQAEALVVEVQGKEQMLAALEYQGKVLVVVRDEQLSTQAAAAAGRQSLGQMPHLRQAARAAMALLRQLPGPQFPELAVVVVDQGTVALM